MNGRSNTCRVITILLVIGIHSKIKTNITQILLTTVLMAYRFIFRLILETQGRLLELTCVAEILQ